MAKENRTSQPTWYALALGRILLGLVFLWAFFDKLFGLKYSTTPTGAWINGGSPTAGFLKGVEGPFASLFHNLAGNTWVDWLFMLGLLGIGLALLLGIVVRLAAISGILLLFLMWAASLPLAANPVIDDHIIYAVFLVAIAYALPHQKVSLAGWWRSHRFIKRNKWLQ